MKTVEELFHEVLASETLKKEFLALRPEEIEAFAARHGCEAKPDEILAFFEAKRNEPGELSDAELDQVAGGTGASPYEAIVSVLGFGFGCAAMAVVSAAMGDAGTDIDNAGGMLCQMDV